MNRQTAPDSGDIRPAGRRRARRAIIWTAAIATFMALLFAAVVFGISPFTKWYVEKNCKELTGRLIRIGDIDIDILSGRITTADVVMYEPDDTTNFVAIGRFDMSIALGELIERPYPGRACASGATRHTSRAGGSPVQLRRSCDLHRRTVPHGRARRGVGAVAHNAAGSRRGEWARDILRPRDRPAVEAVADMSVDAERRAGRYGDVGRCVDDRQRPCTGRGAAVVQLSQRRLYVRGYGRRLRSGRYVQIPDAIRQHAACGRHGRGEDSGRGQYIRSYGVDAARSCRHQRYGARRSLRQRAVRMRQHRRRYSRAQPRRRTLYIRVG